MADTFGKILALAFDHYGTLFDKHAVAKVMEDDFPGLSEELAQVWFKTIKKYCWLSGLMERYLTWDEITKRALTFAEKSLSLEVTDELHEKLIQADLVLPPFPEVPGALERLASKLDLYVLTMASPWMVEASHKKPASTICSRRLSAPSPTRSTSPARFLTIWPLMKLACRKSRSASFQEIPSM